MVMMRAEGKWKRNLRSAAASYLLDPLQQSLKDASKYCNFFIILG